MEELQNIGKHSGPKPSNSSILIIVGEDGREWVPKKRIKINPAKTLNKEPLPD